MFCCFGAPPAKADAAPAPPILAPKSGLHANGTGSKEAVAESQRLANTAVHVDAGDGAAPVELTKTLEIRPANMLGASLSEGAQTVLPSTNNTSTAQHSADPTMRTLLTETSDLLGRQGSFAANSTQSTTRPGTDDAVLGLGDSSGHRSGARGLSLVPSLSPHELRSQVGELVYVGSGATGIVYRGTISSSTPVPGAPDTGYGTEAYMTVPVAVAVKFMICNTPQQLWQRAKEALLSKLVTHPNLVRTLAMDVTLVTPNTYKEWGANNAASTSSAHAHGHGPVHGGSNAHVAGTAPVAAGVAPGAMPAAAAVLSAHGRASMDAPSFATPGLRGLGGSGSGSGSGSQGAGVGTGGSGGSGSDGRVFQSGTTAACSPSTAAAGHGHGHFLAADTTCGTGGGTTTAGSTVTGTSGLMTSTNTLSASMGCRPISQAGVGGAAETAQQGLAAAAAAAVTAGLLQAAVGASDGGSCGPGVAGEGDVRRCLAAQGSLSASAPAGPVAGGAGTAAAALWPGTRDVIGAGGRMASSDGTGAVGGGTSVEVPTPQLPLSANGHSNRALSAVDAHAPAAAGAREPVANGSVSGPSSAADSNGCGALRVAVAADPPQVPAAATGGGGVTHAGVGTPVTADIGLNGSLEGNAASLLPANALSPIGAPTHSMTAAGVHGAHGAAGVSAGGAPPQYGSGAAAAAARCASAVSLLSPLMAPSGTATAACSPFPHMGPSRESSQRSLCPAMSTGQGSIIAPGGAATVGSNGTGGASVAAAVAAAMHATSGVHAHAAAADPSNGGVRPGGPGGAGGDPVPFQDILYHLDAIPGRFLAKVIMEFCDGGTLLTRINAGDYVAHPDRGPLAGLAALRALLWCLQEVAAGMAHLHSLNIIHGDLKPGNVLLTSDDSSPLGYQCKVSDFGLATALEASEQTITHENWGTVVYMAPESCAGRCRKASDVYSFGVLLWQMCTGQRPYAGLQAGQVLLGVKTGTLKLQWPPWANKSLVKVGQACMRFEPKERPGFKGIRSALAKISARLDQKIAAVEAAGLGYDPSLALGLGLGQTAALGGEQGSGEHVGSSVQPATEAEDTSAESQGRDGSVAVAAAQAAAGAAR